MADTEKKLLAVKVWQQMTYLVRCAPGDAKKAVKEPVNRIGKVTEGRIADGDVLEIKDATTQDLETATPTGNLKI